MGAPVLAVCGSGWSGNFPSQGMQRRNIRNRPFSSPPPLLLPFSLFLFWHAKYFFPLPSFFSFPRFIFNVIIIVEYYFWTGTARFLRREPALEGGVQLMSDSGAERRTTRGRGGEGGGAAIEARRRGIYRVVYRHASSFARSERKQRPPRGALPFLCFAYGRLKNRSVPPTDIRTRCCVTTSNFHIVTNHLFLSSKLIILHKFYTRYLKKKYVYIFYIRSFYTFFIQLFYTNFIQDI